MQSEVAILLVEDHADTRKVLALWLRLDSYAVEEADSCAVALSLARQRNFDLLICDIQLPDGDGCELFPQLQQFHALPGIAISGHGREQDVRRCLEAGFKVHLLKPFDYTALRQEMMKILVPKPACGVDRQ